MADQNKRTVVDITSEIHQELILLTKVAGTTIRKEVENALAIHLENRWKDPGILDGLNAIQERINKKVTS